MVPALSFSQSRSSIFVVVCVMKDICYSSILIAVPATNHKATARRHWAADVIKRPTKVCLPENSES